MDRESRLKDLANAPFREYRARAGAAKHAREFLSTAVSRREMLGMLVRRDIKSRYKDSVLGFAWSVARPLTQLAIYYVVIGQVLGAARGIESFAIYVFAGMTIFGLFSETVASGTGSITGNSSLIRKVAIPREVFPLASVGSSIFNFSIQFGILLLAVFILGSGPSWGNLEYAVLAVILVVLFGGAIGLILSAFNVFFRDVQYLVEVTLMLLLWASPILYSWKMVADRAGQGLLLDIYTANPATLAVLGFQKAFWAPGTNDMYPDDLAMRMGVAILISVLLLGVAYWYFTRVQGRLVQEL